jgi:methyl-accepting chemotaxis protein
MFSNMKLATKLFGAFLVVLALMAGFGAYSISRLAAVNDVTADLSGNWMPGVKAALLAKSNINRIRVLELRSILESDPAAIAVAEKEGVERIAATRKLWADYEKLVSSPEERSLYDAFKADMEIFFAEHVKIGAFGAQNKKAEARALVDGQSLKAYNAVRATSDKLSDLNIAGGDKAAVDAGQAYETARSWTIGILVACSALALLMAWAITRAITRPLAQAVKVANQRLLQRERPDVRELITYNAEVNRHMIEVNERLGFAPVARLGEFQKLPST